MTKKTQPNSKARLKELLDGNIFLDEPTLDGLRAKIGALNDAQIEALLWVFTEADNRQNGLLLKIINDHPDFISRLDYFTAKTIRDMTKKAEQSSRKADLRELNELWQTAND